MSGGDGQFQNIAIVSAEPSTSQHMRDHILITYSFSRRAPNEWQHLFQNEYRVMIERNLAIIEELRDTHVRLAIKKDTANTQIVELLRPIILQAIDYANREYPATLAKQCLAAQEKEREAQQQQRQFDQIAETLKKQFPGED